MTVDGVGAGAAHAAASTATMSAEALREGGFMRAMYAPLTSRPPAMHTSDMRRSLLTLTLALGALAARAQDSAFTHADTLRGSNGPARDWWHPVFYDLSVRLSLLDSTVTGRNAIVYRALRPGHEMQIDLQVPLVLDSAKQFDKKLAFRRDGNAYFITLGFWDKANDARQLIVWWHGKPRIGKRLPWDGGFTWQRDSLGNPWIATANEGLGASVWWPVKDILSDEPDSQRIAITVPDSLIDVSNGRLRSTRKAPNGETTYEWFVTVPINTYDVEINAGRYAHYADSLKGEGGMLTLDFWPLAYHVDAAKKQWQQVVPMLKCFEHWYGPYPFYADGYKLIEAPHLGMEHQSGVAYGNHFLNGYLGRDLSHTGIGLQWDFIIVHESAHEWWGNSISVKDHADMWVHESFANYSEGIYTECLLGKEAGAAYMIGARAGVKNDRPIVGPYGVNKSGSGDMYPKGGNMLHTIRAIIDDDAKWRQILRGLQMTYWHQTVSGQEVQDYISQQSGFDLAPVFAQYLTTTKIPVFEYRVTPGWVLYRWNNVVANFAMPVKVQVPGIGTVRLTPATEWQRLAVTSPLAAQLTVDENFYVTQSNVTATAESAPAKTP